MNIETNGHWHRFYHLVCLVEDWYLYDVLDPIDDQHGESYCRSEVGVEFILFSVAS